MEERVIKRRRSNVAEKKIGGSYKMKPSVKALAMKFIKEDDSVRSFNDLLEVSVKEYINKRKKVPRIHDKQKTFSLDEE